MSSDVAELERAVDGMPDDWRDVAIADVVAMLPGFAFKSEHFVTDTDGGLPLIRIRDLGQTATVTRYVGGYDEAFAVQDGDILVGMDGEFAAVRWQGGKALLNQRVLKLSTARPDAMDEGYLFYRVQPALLELEQTISGTTVKHLSTKDLKRLTWQIPSLDEQRRIAKVLRSVDEAIAAADAVATSMLRASKTMRHELLNVAPDGTVIDLPPDWTVLPLEALASVERGKFSIRPRNDPRYFGGSTPFIQTGDITTAGDYITRHTQTLNDLGVGVSRVFAAGTIMTTIAANIGDFAIASYPVACPDSVVGIEANADVHPFWLYSVLTCFKAALDRAATQNAQKNINLQTLRPLQIPVPPPSLMIELAETFAAAADGALQAKASVAKLTATKQSLMSDLRSGRVRVPA